MIMSQSQRDSQPVQRINTDHVSLSQQDDEYCDPTVSNAATDHGDEGSDDYDDNDDDQDMETRGMYLGNIAAACDAVNAACKKPFRSEEEKREERRAANRRSAKMSRDRKKLEREQLQEKATQLAQVNLALTKENQELRKQISMLLSQQSQGHDMMTGALKVPPVAGLVPTVDAFNQDLFRLQLLQAEQQKKRTAALMSSGIGLSHQLNPASGLTQGTNLRVHGRNPPPAHIASSSAQADALSTSAARSQFLADMELGFDANLKNKRPRKDDTEDGDSLP